VSDQAHESANADPAHVAPGTDEEAWARCLDEGLRTLETDDLAGISLDHLAERICRLRAVTDRLELAATRHLAVFDARGGARAQGLPSTVTWLSRHGRLSGSQAKDRVELARRYAELPGTTAAVRGGQIGFEAATVVARTASEVGAATVARTPEVQAEASRLVETELLAAAQRMDAGRLREQARQVRHRVDPEGAEEATARAWARRGLRLGVLPDGMVTLDGRLDAEGGTMLRAALEVLMPPPRKGDQRTAVQRRADAQVEMARRFLDNRPASAGRGRRPQMRITVPAAALEVDRQPAGAELGSDASQPTANASHLAADAAPRAADAAQPAADAAQPAADAAQPAADAAPPAAEAAVGIGGMKPGLGVAKLGLEGAELGPGGAMVPATTAQRYACDAVVRMMEVDARGNPVRVSKARRVVLPSTWAALDRRDQGCVLCGAPTDWCDAHHWRRPFRLDQQSTLEDLCLLCRHCHRVVHDGRLRIAPGPDGTWLTFPDGPRTQELRQ
jgi:hypothetical protein